MPEKHPEAPECPLCGLINEPTIRYCECGFDLHGGRREERLARSARRVRVLKHALRGGAVFALGVAITAFTLEYAPGGVTVFAYGAIAVGAFDLMIGLGEFVRLLAARREEGKGDNKLDG